MPPNFKRPEIGRLVWFDCDLMERYSREEFVAPTLGDFKEVFGSSCDDMEFVGLVGEEVGIQERAHLAAVESDNVGLAFESSP